MIGTSESIGGTVWRIKSESPDNKSITTNRNNNNKSMNKPALIPRFIETKDRYWVNMYGPLYCKTMTLVGFDRLSTNVTLPNKVLPRLIEWDSKVQYEVNNKILQQPRDWANILTTSCASGEYEGVEDDDGNNNDMASLADIKSQVSTPYVLNSSSSPTRTNSFDTPTNSSVSTLPQTSTATTNSSTAKKGRYM